MAKYIIKLKDNNGDYIGTVSPDKLKNRIFFNYEINGGYGELELKFDLDFGIDLGAIFTVELYAITNVDKEGTQIYKGILDQQNGIKRSFEEVTFRFIGYGSILYNQLYYDYGTSDLEFSFTNAQDPSGWITDFINKVNTQRFSFTSVSGTFTNGEDVVGGTSGTTGNLKRYYSGSGYAYILPLAGERFTDGETVTGQSSGATATINIAYQNKWQQTLNPGTVNSYGKVFSYEPDYDSYGFLLDKIMDFSDGYYFFIGTEGFIDYKALPTTSNHKLIFGKDVLEMEEKKRYNDIINRVYVGYDNSGTLDYVMVEDTTSIGNYGLRETSTGGFNIQNSTSATEIGNRTISNNKEPTKEIKLKVDFNNYEYIKQKTRWQDVTSQWDTQTSDWESYSVRQTAFDIYPGEKVDVKNIELGTKRDNLLVSKVRFEEDYLLITCNTFKNFTNLIS